MQRLYTAENLEKHVNIRLSDAQSHYLTHVMRANANDPILLFNAVSGEWQAHISEITKKGVTVQVENQTRVPAPESPLRLIFAPIKRGHGDLVVEKATECGVTRLSPLLTRHTVVSRVPLERYQAIATEAAEQCERLSVPEIDSPMQLDTVLAGWTDNVPLLLCAETGDAQPIAEALQKLEKPPAAIMVGPEGGFAESEFALLRKQNFVIPVSLGPRILRADTAAITALGITQALKGDWMQKR